MLQNSYMTHRAYQILRRLCATIISVCAVCCFIGIIPAHAAIQSGEPSPSFLTYINQSSASRTERVASTGHSGGLIPSPVDLSHLNGKHVSARRPGAVRGALPSSYDLRTSPAPIVKLTPVKDQGTYNTSWAFAALASLESTLTPLETRDFSENNMVNRSGYDLAFNDGGNMLMATAYLTRWDGPVDETADPYPSPGNSPQGLPAQKAILDVLFIPGRSLSAPLDNDNIKQAVIDYGPVMTSMYIDTTTYFNTAENAYYCPDLMGFQHAVAIVGWDDDYPSTNFLAAPGGNGAFIVRNSWGTSWGDGGYFYVSYYDRSIGTDDESNAVFLGNQNLSQNIIYQHDPLGATKYLSSKTNPQMIWGANVFTALNNEEVRAVGFYTLDTNTSYEISVYDEWDGTRFSGLRAQQAGVMDPPGYHTIELQAPVSFARGHTFCVVVKLTNVAAETWLATESPIAGYCSPVASAGQSYVSVDGVTWADVTVEYPNTNVCLKAYTALRVIEDHSTLSRAVAYPNPINFSKAVNGTLKFENLTDSARVKIFDVTGRLVKSLDPATPGSSDNSATAVWDGTNEGGMPVAMGIYLYLISDRADNRARGKIVVLK